MKSFADALATFMTAFSTLVGVTFFGVVLNIIVILTHVLRPSSYSGAIVALNSTLLTLQFAVVWRAGIMREAAIEAMKEQQIKTEFAKEMVEKMRHATGAVVQVASHDDDDEGTRH